MSEKDPGMASEDPSAQTARLKTTIKMGLRRELMMVIHLMAIGVIALILLFLIGEGYFAESVFTVIVIFIYTLGSGLVFLFDTIGRIQKNRGKSTSLPHME
jgi:hypothetical protein